MEIMKLTRQSAICVLGIFLTSQAFADFTTSDASKLQNEASAAEARFRAETSGEEDLLNNAKALLICPKITKGGLIIGVESGDCVLQVDGKTVEYYSNHAAKVGVLSGIEWYSLILVFKDQADLDIFTTSKGDWEIGVDASVAVAEIGAGASLDTTNIKKSIVAFIFGEKGFIGDLSLEGSSFKKLEVAGK